MKSVYLVILLILLALVAVQGQGQTVNDRLAEWDRLDQAAYDKAVNALTDYGTGLQQGIPGFSAEIHTLGAKAKTLFDATYAQAVWDTRIGSEQQIVAAIDQIVQNFVYEVEANRNLMLLQIEADLRAIGKVNPHIKLDSFQQLIRQQAHYSSRRAARQALLTECVSLVVTEIVTSLVTRTTRLVAAEGGICLSGCLATFGVALVVGIVVDVITSELSIQDTSRQLREAMSQLQSQILEQFKSTMSEALNVYRVKKQREVMSCAQF